MNARQELELEKNNFYRDEYRKTLGWLSLMVFLGIGLAALLAYITIDQKKPHYYATTASGLVIPLHTLSEPIVTNDYLLQWVSLATRKALNMDFVHYQEQLDAAKIYFTSSGWDQFLIALDKSGLLKTVQDKKLMMNAVVSNTPVILHQDIFHGRYTWRVQLPFLVTFNSASESSQLRLLVTANVQRVSVLDTSQGIQVSDFVVDHQ